MKVASIKLRTRSKGALLLELLIVISLLVVILGVSANGVFLSLKSNKAVEERDRASALALESMTALRATGSEDWQNIYSTTKGGTHYRTVQSSGKWILEAGDETISLNTVSYTRYVTFENVSRDSTTRDIQTTYSAPDDDPSTQKAIITVSWPNADAVVVSGYFFRFKNKICDQTDWSTGAGSGVKTCPDSTYGEISPAGTINTSGGEIKLQ